MRRKILDKNIGERAIRLIVSALCAMVTEATSAQSPTETVAPTEDEQLAEAADKLTDTPKTETPYIIDQESLRRTAYTAFETRKYTTAVEKLEKLRKRGLDNETDKQTLRWAYYNLGRRQAMREVEEEMADDGDVTRRKKFLTDVYAEGGALFDNNVHESEQQINQKMDLEAGYYALASLNTRIGKRWEMEHALTFYRMEGTETLTMPDNNTKKTAVFQHMAYVIGNSISLGDGWNAEVAGSIFYLKDKYYILGMDTTSQKFRADNAWTNDNNQGQGGSREWNERNAQDIWRQEAERISQYEAGYDGGNVMGLVGLTKNWYKVGANASLSYGRIEDDNIWQPELTIWFYPFGNLDLYASTKIADVWNNGHNMIYAEKAGAKICRWLWAEAEWAHGNMCNYQENNLKNVLTTLYKTKYRWTANLIFPISKRLTANVMYRYMRKTTPRIIWPEDEIVYWTEEKDHSNTITGGIKWVF